MSVRHNEELAGQLRESEWLKKSLLECSNALHEAIMMLSSQTATQEVSKHLAGVAHKFNIENISSACKSSLVPSSSTEKLEFLSRCRGEKLEGIDSAGAERSSASKPPSTMALIESLMTSALNADNTLTATGCNGGVSALLSLKRGTSQVSTETSIESASGVRHVCLRSCRKTH